MTPMLHSDQTVLRVALDDFIETHGRWRVLLALLVRPMRPKARLPTLGLNAHLRRDIGLEPLVEGGPPRDPLLKGVPPLHPLAGRGGGR